MIKPKLQSLDLKLTVHRLSPATDVPPVVLQGDFFSISRTTDELTIICDSAIEIFSEQSEIGWSAIQVAGPLDFSLTGILAGIATVLARAEISILLSLPSILTISLYAPQMTQAHQALEAEGYPFDPPLSRSS